MSQHLIVGDPGLLGGTPVVSGTRLSVEHLLELTASGATPAQLLARYPQLTPEGLAAAYRYAAAVVSGSRHAGRCAASTPRPTVTQS
jgi:uncharacterized protein (DUF433 family)